MTEFKCSKCGYVLEDQPADADTWTCPVCGTKNVIEDAPTHELTEERARELVAEGWAEEAT